MAMNNYFDQPVGCLSKKDIPVGYRFRPTEEELLTHFLQKKATGQPLPEAKDRILDRQLYGENATPWEVLTEALPWEDLEGSNKKVLHVFCKLIPKNGRSKNRVSRIAGCGTWEGKAVGQEIIKDHIAIGQKRQFTFKPKKGFEQSVMGRGHWIMHEFSLAGSTTEDYVLCRITKDFSKEFNDAVDNYSSTPKRKLPRVSDGEDADILEKKKGRGIMGQENNNNQEVSSIPDPAEMSSSASNLYASPAVDFQEQNQYLNNQQQQEQRELHTVENLDEFGFVDSLLLPDPGFFNFEDDNQLQLIDPSIADPSPINSVFTDRFIVEQELVIKSPRQQYFMPTI